MAREILTFWGRLTKDGKLYTSEGLLRHVIAPEEVERDVYSYVWVVKHHRNYLIIKQVKQ